MEISGKDIKVPDHVLGEGVTGKVYFADCYGFNAAAKVNVCLDGKVIGVAYTWDQFCCISEPVLNIEKHILLFGDFGFTSLQHSCQFAFARSHLGNIRLR